MKKKLLFVTIAGLALIGGGLYAAWRHFGSEIYSGNTTRLYIPEGATDSSIRDTLSSNLGSFGDKVYQLWDIQDGAPSIAHGSYLVDSGMTAINVARAIAHGSQTPIRLTVNNMRTFGDFATRVGKRLEIDSASIVATADTLLLNRGFAPEEFSAAILPDTYEFYWTASANTVLNTMLRTRNAFWDSTRIAKAEALGLTPAQVATVASIVEEETNKADERPKVARLYLNRLKTGMLLQADPTIKFALGDFSLRRINTTHLNVESPYNTYLYQGLPPGPIRITERATLDAVLNAPQHDYLYMCAKPDFSGYHNFARDYNRHRINAARYHRALNARGIR